MKTAPYAGIARVLLTGGPRLDDATGRHIRHAGMGILLDSRRLLTCAHVVNTAIGRVPKTATHCPAKDVAISLDFPLSADRTEMIAHVERWEAPGLEPAADVAVLLLDGDAPADVGFAGFQLTDDWASRAELSVYGWSADSDVPGNVTLKLMGPISPSQIQIDGATHTGSFIEGGYSGAAVWDLARNHVVGMVNALNARIADRVAYMIPVAQLISVVPDLRVGESVLTPFFRDYVAEKTAGFVGREHVFAEIQQFLASADSGYLTLIGDPGIGKSAILGSLSQRMRCGASFFFIRSDGITRADQMYTHLGEQLRTRWAETVSTASGVASGAALREWLASAAKSLRGDRLIIVIDALDECDEVLRRDNVANLLYLPRSLPKNVFLIMSRRDLNSQEFNVRLETYAGTKNEEVDLMRFRTENRADVALYLKSYFAAQPGPHPWLQRHGRSVEQGIDDLVINSEYNFVYLHYVLPHITEHPEEFTPTTLPKGLREYYVGHRKRMTSGRLGSGSVQRALEVIYVLAVARKAVSHRQLEEALPHFQSHDLNTAIAQWQEFLHVESGSDGRAYRIYHNSFADFLVECDPERKQIRGASATLRDWFIRKLTSPRQP